MQVLKFGWTSLADSAAIARMVDIVEKALEGDRTIVVCSAIARCTDSLIEICHLAAKQDESYLRRIADLKRRHQEIVAGIIPDGYRKKTSEAIETLFSSLENISQMLDKAGIIAGVVLSFARALGEYGATMMISGYTPGRTATISTTVYQLWQTNDEKGAMFWVLINLAISTVVLLTVNMLETRQRKAGKA